MGRATNGQSAQARAISACVLKQRTLIRRAYNLGRTAAGGTACIRMRRALVSAESPKLPTTAVKPRVIS
jgi:hypothetical protein